MGKIKKSLVAVGAGVIGLVTLRAVRNRRSEDDEAVEAETEEAEAELQTAAEHAAAAVGHAGEAVKVAVEQRRETVD